MADILVVACAIVISVAVAFGYAAAQTAATPGMLVDGNAVVTGFSGARPPALLRPGADPADKTMIDLNGPALRVIDLQAPGAPAQAQVVFAPKSFTVTASQIGQVFAIALDNASPPNIYAAATSIFGLPIVVPDVDNDGLPDRWEEGTANARYMPGLFGPAALGGGPGSIWRIDGVTGAVRLFANVALDGVPNAGPALGGLAFDPASNSLFVADRETGMIHRFDMAGVERGRYDHGTTGRRAAGLAALPFDPAKRLNIKSPPFQPANPDSWGYTAPPRRIFGLAARAGRLYYAVAEGLQVWSVAIAPDGAFGSDARMEITVPPGQSASEISKIAFDDRGGMLLAERVAPSGSFDFTAMTEEGGGRVLRYRRAPSAAGSAWQPDADEYAVGFAAHMRGGNGGVAVGYGFDGAGRLDRNACGGFVWTTGEQLRAAQDPSLATQLMQRGPANVNGVQGGAIDRAGAPPLQSYFVDFDDRFDDAKARGHLGDVAVFRSCAPGAVAAVPAPPAVAPPGPGVAGAPPQPWPAPPLALGLPPIMPPGMPPAGQQMGQQFGPQLPGPPPAPPPVAGQAAGQPMAQQLVPVPGQVVGQIQVQPPGQVGQGPAPQPPAPPPVPQPVPPVTQGAAQPPAPPPQPVPPVTQGAAQPPGAPTAPAGGIAIVPPPGAPAVVSGSQPQPPATGGVIEGELEVIKKMVVGGITISKHGPMKCYPGKTCDFTIWIKGATATPSGVFEVRDIPPLGWMFMGNASGPNWNCKSPADCTYNVTKHSQWPKNGLTAQSKQLQTNVAFRVPSNAKDGVVENCVNATFPPAAGQSNKTIAVACWKVEVVNPPNLTITKTLDKPNCAPGEQCDFKITVKNTGGAPYKGFLTLTDSALPQEFDFESLGSSGSGSGLKCESGMPDFLFQCHKAGLDDGQQFVVAVKAKLKPNAAAAQIENCAKLYVPGPDPKDLLISGNWLVRDFLDYHGFPMDTAAQGGPLTEAEKKAIADYKKQHPVKDAQGNADTSGEVTDSLLKSILPPKANASGDFLQSCAKINSKESGLLVYKESTKPPGWSATVPQLTCFTDEPCGFVVKVSGRDATPYTKPIKIEEQLPQGFQLVDYQPKGPGGWTCSGPPYKLVCTHPPANLTNKDILELTVYAQIEYWTAQNIYGIYMWGRVDEFAKNCVKAVYDNPKQYDQEPMLPPAPGQVHPGRHWQACYKQKITSRKHNLMNYNATGSGPCYPPNCSYYDFTITSRDPYGRGPLTQRITPPAGSAMHDIRVTKAPPACPASRWSCTRTGTAPAGEFTCRIDDCTLMQGDQVVTRIEGSVAPDLTEPPPAPIQKTACGALEWDAPRSGDSIEQQSGQRIEVACAAIMVLARPPAAPLAPTCAAGYDLLPSGICCLAGQATLGGQCCPAGQQPDPYRQTCVPVAASAPPSAAPWPAPALQTPWPLIVPGQRTPPQAQPGLPAPPTSPRPWAQPSQPAPQTPQMQAVPAQPALQCTGGKVPAGNRCVCPSGTTEMRGLCVPAGATPKSPQVQQMQPQLQPAPQMQQLQIGPAQPIPR